MAFTKKGREAEERRRREVADRSRRLQNTQRDRDDRLIDHEYAEDPGGVGGLGGHGKCRRGCRGTRGPHFT